MENYRGEDDFSIVSQSYRNYEELFEAPPIEYPVTEAVTRSSYSDLPDGSDYDELLTAPIGEPLDKAIFRMSRAANAAWEDFFNHLLDSHPDATTIEDLFLDSSDKLHYTRIRRLRLVDDSQFQKNHIKYVSRLLSEVTWQSESKEVTQISLIERKSGAPSLKERNALATLTNFNTNIWRKSASSYAEDNYLPNIGMSDDPDFIPPSGISSRNFAMYPPASRPYDITFRVTMQDGSIKLLYPDPNKEKDYTSLSSIRYMLNHKNVKFKDVAIHEIERKHNTPVMSDTRYIPCCSFEPDIRVTYGKDLFPDPVNYKKVDTDTKLGKSILQKLNEQPHLFQDFAVKVDGVNKLVVYYTVKGTHDPIGPRVYWTYVDENTYPVASRTSKGQIRFMMAKTIFPQITYTPLKYPNSDKVHPFTAVARVTQGAFYRHNETGQWVNFNEIEQNLIDYLSDKGYILINQSREVLNNQVLVYKFIHKNTSTRYQRKKIFLSLTKKSHD